jgi:hypothetical protein
VATGRKRQRACVSASPANCSVATSKPQGPIGRDVSNGAKRAQPASARQAAVRPERWRRRIKDITMPQYGRSHPAELVAPALLDPFAALLRRPATEHA